MSDWDLTHLGDPAARGYRYPRIRRRRGGPTFAQAAAAGLLPPPYLPSRVREVRTDPPPNYHLDEGRLPTMAYRDPLHKTLIGHVSVDSGQIFLTDPCYLKDGDWAAGADDAFASDSYRAVCTTTLGADPVTDAPSAHPDRTAGDVQGGVAVATEIGDGSFPVYALHDASGRLRRIVIKIQ